MLAAKNLCVAFLLSLTLAGAVIFCICFPCFDLRGIQVEGNQKVSYSEILMLCPIKLGQNLFSLNTDGIKRGILSEPRIQKVHVKRKFPCGIIIKLEEKKPCLLINLGNMYGLTRQGEIIPLDEDMNLPVVNGIEPERISPYHRPKSEKVNSALYLYDLLARDDARISKFISEINIEDKNNIILYLMPQGAKVFLGWGDFPDKFGRLSLILRQENEFEKLQYIDLRFKGQAIVRRLE